MKEGHLELYSSELNGVVSLFVEAGDCFSLQ